MDASLTKDGPTYTVRFERQLAHPPEKVWRVLTEPGLLNQWFPQEVEGEWIVGAKLRFVMKSEDFRGEVLAVDPPRLLAYRWGESVLRCELIAEGDNCRLIFSESFEDSSIAARDAAGWEMCLSDLEAVLAERTPTEFEMDAWRVVFNRYVPKFEPQAGPQRGPPSV